MNPTANSPAANSGEPAGTLVAVTKAVINRVALVHDFDLPPHIADAMADALDSVVETAIESREHDLVILGFKMGLLGAFGPELSQAALLTLSGQATVSGAKLCPNHSRAHVSKVVNRIRRNLGITGGYPNNARPGRAPKN